MVYNLQIMDLILDDIQLNCFMERVIQIGLDNPDQVEVLDGLSENDRLVIKGFETPSNRSKVNIVQ